MIPRAELRRLGLDPPKAPRARQTAAGRPNATRTVREPRASPDRPPAGRVTAGVAIALTLPLPPRRNTAADRHWRYRHRAKLVYDSRADAWCLLRRQHPPAVPFARATIRAVCTVRGKNDTDGLMARLKWTLDYLVSRGYVADDNPDVLHWPEPPSQVVSRTQEPSVTITLDSLHPVED